jgi:hypothetical protein
VIIERDFFTSCNEPVKVVESVIEHMNELENEEKNEQEQEEGY